MEGSNDRAGNSLPADVAIEQVSDSMLRIKVADLVTDVSVERIYRSDRHFGEFRSLDHLIDVLRKIAEEQS